MPFECSKLAFLKAVQASPCRQGEAPSLVSGAWLGGPQQLCPCHSPTSDTSMDEGHKRFVPVPSRASRAPERLRHRMGPYFGLCRCRPRSLGTTTTDASYCCTDPYYQVTAAKAGLDADITKTGISPSQPEPEPPMDVLVLLAAAEVLVCPPPRGREVRVDRLGRQVGIQARGRAWVQVPFGGTFSDADDLGPHLGKVAQSAYAECCMNEHNTSKAKALKHICKAVANSPGGLHVQASTAFWSHKGLSHRDISLTLQARFSSLDTRAFLATRHAGESEVCSLCGLTSDTVPHRLGGCTHPVINSRVNLRHGCTVDLLAHMVGMGRHGDCFICFMLHDAEGHDGRYRLFPGCFLCTDRLPSRPDLVLLEGTEQGPGGRSHGINKDARLHLVEFTFTPTLQWWTG